MKIEFLHLYLDEGVYMSHSGGGGGYKKSRTKQNLQAEKGDLQRETSNKSLEHKSNQVIK